MVIKRNLFTMIIVLLLICSMLFSMVGCTQNVGDKNNDSDGVTDFGVNLLRVCNDSEKNTFISPMSVAYALAMAMNGAEGETLSQIEEIIGLTRAELNSKLSEFMSHLLSGQDAQLKVANSVWYRDDSKLSLQEDFLNINQKNFNAESEKSPFDDSTIRDINQWVEENTDGMIDNIIKEIPQEAMLFLINAIAFDAKWEEVYQKHQVESGIFTREDDSQENVDLMYSSEHTYLEDEHATGFVKYYQGRKYAFAALLPKEGTNVSEYLSKLSGKHIEEVLSNAQSLLVKTAIPKFEIEYEVEMSGILKKMGIIDAFDSELAEFSGIGSSRNIFLNKVLHKTYISVAEEGTRAAAITADVMMGTGLKPADIKEVYLDRPFVYMLIDCDTNTPIFIGTMMSVNE